MKSLSKHFFLQNFNQQINSNQPHRQYPSTTTIIIKNHHHHIIIAIIISIIRKCEFYTTRVAAVLEPRRYQPPSSGPGNNDLPNSGVHLLHVPLRSRTPMLQVVPRLDRFSASLEAGALQTLSLSTPRSGGEFLQALPPPSSPMLRQDPNSAGKTLQILPSISSQTPKLGSNSTAKIFQVLPSSSGPVHQDNSCPSSILVQKVPCSGGKIVKIGSKSYFVVGGHRERAGSRRMSKNEPTSVPVSQKIPEESQKEDDTRKASKIHRRYSDNLCPVVD